MKYICSVCGYVYDEDSEKIPFTELPDDWTCPMCKAPKSLFEAEEETEAPEIREIEESDDMEQLSPGVLAALFSNLARGAQKQYKTRESELFSEIAGYFTAASPSLPEADPEMIKELTENDLTILYRNLNDIASSAADRGALRVKVWGEKVTKIVNAIVSRYIREGGDFLSSTEIWVCSICGFVYIGDTPPAICPVCKVPDWKFDRIEGGT